MGYDLIFIGILAVAGVIAIWCERASDEKRQAGIRAMRDFTRVL